MTSKSLQHGHDIYQLKDNDLNISNSHEKNNFFHLTEVWKDHFVIIMGSDRTKKNSTPTAKPVQQKNRPRAQL